MGECFRCGINDEKALLYDAITSEGIQQICRKCSHREEIPFMKNKDVEELKEFERKQDIYERISRVSGGKREVSRDSGDVVLRNLVEKNVCNGLGEDANKREDLIKNFHWAIRRYRRLKKLSTRQLAEEIEEVEKTIILAEQGVVPEGYDLIKKLQVVLGIQLIRQEIVGDLGREEARSQELSFEKQSSKEITIADLQRMKAEKEMFVLNEDASEDAPEFIEKGEEIEEGVSYSQEGIGQAEPLSKLDEIKNGFDGSFVEKESAGEKEVQKEIKREMSQKEIDDLIFGRK